jgi:hypothetical protein
MIIPIHEFRASCRTRWRVGGLALHLALAGCGATAAVAAPPDLTAGGTVPTTDAGSGTINLGATGMRGWVYHVNENSSESRQILVTAVAAGSPADGVLATNDVILGADGTSANPVAFSADARKSLATAIADAEARNPGVLKFLRWRAGATTTVQITLRTMGAYSATAPYNCPKSAKILREAVDYFLKHQTAGKYSFGTLALLAVKDPADPNNAAYQTRAQTEARALVPSAATMAQLMSNERDATSMVTWQRGHTLIVLAEYYLATHDAVVLPAIEAYAVNIARNQSMFGTVGHIFAEKNPDGSDNGPMGGVYGVVNSTGLPCFYGLLLARECGVTHATLAPAIERTSRFFAYYSGKGAIPYGEHEPYYQGHENNGKSGLCALAFALQTNRVNEGRFFTKMATASPGEREIGHTGAFFNYLWAPLGAACGGEQAAAAYFSKASWHYDLVRRWDGSFVYDYTGSNGSTPSNGAEYNDFRMTAAALLTYALPLRNLCITGRNQNPSPLLLGSADVTAAIAANDYNPASRSTNELVTDLGNWSPKVRSLASDQLKTRTVNAALISQVTALANDPNGTSRVGACLALGKIIDSGSASARAATLAALLTDADNHVRLIAAESLRNLASSRNPVVNTILSAAATTARPVKPFVEEDPLQFTHAKAAMLLFYSGSAYGPKGVLYNNITGVDRNLLYPAIKAVAATPTGLARSTLASTYKLLTLNDTLAVADAIVDSVQFRAPADKMFTSGVRQGGIEVLQKYGFAEGVPLSLIYMNDDVRDTVKPAAIAVLKAYAGSCTTVVPDPGVIGFLQSLLPGSQAANAQAALDAITAVPNTNPGPATPLKNIQSTTADTTTLTLPAQSTVLRVNATDYARGPNVASIYTWRKVHGAGSVTFTPNGTTGAAATTIQIQNLPGHYLFEVTMSDSRGLTQVAATVPVTLYNSGGTLPPNNPPTAAAQQVTVAKATPAPITLTGSDPEGYELVFLITHQPLHGRLSGSVPNLLYTPDSVFTGTDSFTFEVMDSEGQRTAATVGITVSDTPPPLAIYESFNYPTGGLNGKGGTTEVGLTGTWSANASAMVVAGSLSYGALPVGGGSIGGLNGGSNNFGGARAVSAPALAGNGLLADDATLWFSVVMGYDTGGNVTNSRLALALANSQFSSSNYNYNIINEGSQLGSGIGVTLGRFNSANGYTVATHFRDPTTGAGFDGNVFGTLPATAYPTGGQYGLIVGKIVWGAASDTIELYRPDANLNLGPVISTLTVSVDQSTFDTITWARGDKVVMDEIRFGASYSSVLFGTAPDLSPPTPDPAQWATAPAAISDSAITMTATTASDPSGVEYFFDCTTAGGHDSAWQDSPTYTDTGLAPMTSYVYQVRTRDMSPAANTGTASSALGATTEAGDISPPAPDPMQWLTPPTTASESSITMTAVDAEDASGVQYFFACTTAGGHDSGWQDSPTYTDTGLSPATSYAYQVKARDKSPAANETNWSPVAAAGPASAYAAWAATYPGLDLSDPIADPDGDGLANLIEAWFGTHPGQCNAGLAGVATDGTTTTFNHPQNPTPPAGVSGSYEWSPNLADWYASGGGPGGGPTVTMVPATVGATTTVTATASAVLPHLFLRATATRN